MNNTVPVAFVSGIVFVSVDGQEEGLNTDNIDGDVTRMVATALSIFEIGP